MKRNRRGNRPSIGQILAYLLFSLIGFAWLTLFVWNLLFGVPARMTIDHCQHHSILERRNGPDCVGHLSGAPPDQGSMLVDNAGPGDVGREVNVHISGSGSTAKATKDGWSWEPVMGFVIGVGSGYMAILAIVRRIRRAPDVGAESQKIT